MTRRAKKKIVKDEPKYKGSSLKISQKIPGNVYWIAQVVLDDDTYYTIPEALTLIENKKNERGV